MSLFFFVIGAWAISLLGSFLLDFIQKRAKKQTHEQSFQSLPFSFFVLSPHLSLSPPVTKLPVNSSAQALQASSDFYGCETWTLLADSEKRIQAFEFKCMRKLLHTSYLEHETNDQVLSKINFLVGPQEPLLATVKRRKLAWFEYATHLDSLSKTILQGTLEGGRCRGQQRKCWIDNITEWTSLPMAELLTRASCRKDWQRISAESSLMSS